jgi:hypothetical protein
MTCRHVDARVGIANGCAIGGVNAVLKIMRECPECGSSQFTMSGWMDGGKKVVSLSSTSDSKGCVG